MRAIFGPPRNEPVADGAQIAVYLVPVLDGALVAFEVHAGAVQGRWLPWAVIDFGQNPYEAASVLADDWLGEPLRDLRLADVLSSSLPDGGWELAIIFRAELAAAARGDAERSPFVFPPGQYDAFGTFDPVDIQRWVELPAPTQPPQADGSASSALLF